MSDEVHGVAQSSAASFQQVSTKQAVDSVLLS